MKYGLVIFDGKIENYFAFAKTLDVSHLEIDLFAGEQKLNMFTPRRVKEVKNLASSNGVTLSLHLPYCLNPAGLIPEVIPAVLEYYRNAFHLAAELGALWVTIHPGYYQGLAGWEWMRQEAMQKLREVLSEALFTCGSHKIPLAVENNTRQPGNGQFFNLGSCVDDFKEIFDWFDSPFIRMCLDTGHANTAEGVMPYLKNFLNQIISIHIHDNLGKVDEHLLPGKGTVEWQMVLDYLTKNDYAGFLNVELLKDDDKKAACDYIRRENRNNLMQRRTVAL